MHIINLKREKPLAKIAVSSFLVFNLFMENREAIKQETGKILIKKLGISRANLCDIEKGRRLPSIGRASVMAKKLGEIPQFWVEMVLQDMIRQEKMKYIVRLETKDAA